jgi:hypothetical protein
MNSNIIVTQSYSEAQFQNDAYGWPDPFLIPNALAMQDLIELLPPDCDCYLFPDGTSVDVKPTLRTTTLPPGARTHQYLFLSPVLGLVEVRVFSVEFGAATMRPMTVVFPAHRAEVRSDRAGRKKLKNRDALSGQQPIQFRHQSGEFYLAMDARFLHCGLEVAASGPDADIELCCRVLEVLASGDKAYDIAFSAGQ